MSNTLPLSTNYGLYETIILSELRVLLWTLIYSETVQCSWTTTIQFIWLPSTEFQQQHELLMMVSPVSCHKLNDQRSFISISTTNQHFVIYIGTSMLAAYLDAWALEQCWLNTQHNRILNLMKSFQKTKRYICFSIISWHWAFKCKTKVGSFFAANNYGYLLLFCY